MYLNLKEEFYVFVLPVFLNFHINSKDYKYGAVALFYLYFFAYNENNNIRTKYFNLQIIFIIFSKKKNFN
jgi:hypothetical protein